MRPVILTVNAGSSSLRLAAFAGSGLAPLASRHDETGTAASTDPAEWLRGHGIGTPDAVAHRIVHGGVEFIAPVAIDDRVEAAIGRLAPLAPLHNPVALQWIRTARQAWGPDLPQVAVFDTAFFAHLPAAASRYALPDFGPGEPIRRYGFHGIAHEALLTAWRERHPEGGARTISLQLGAGCSMTAALGGRPIETSMGFTPLEGLVMATRGGDVDPGLLLHLLQQRGRTAAELERILNHESGLRGLSGISGDMRVLLASAEPAARLAVDVYCHRIRKYLGAYLAVLGGADAILFGGGVGEHSAAIRERVLTGLEFAGVRLDRERNLVGAASAAIPSGLKPLPQNPGARAIHARDSAVEIWVLAADEERFLARAALELIGEHG